MNDRLDHETCSEMLGSYVRGRLDATRAELVRAHLEDCSVCRGEEAALRRMLEPVTPLSPEESAQLREAVSAGIRRPAPVTDLTSSRSRRASSWRPLQVLGAAAVLLIAFVVVRTGVPMGGKDGGQTEAAGEVEAVADVADRLTFRRPSTTGAKARRAELNDAQALQVGADEAAPEEDAGAGGGAAAGSAKEGGDLDRSSAYATGPPGPLFVRGAGNLDEQRLKLVGRYGLPLVLFPSAYTVEDAERMQDDFLVRLANAAGNDAQTDQVIECGAQVIGQRAALPALAAFGRYRGQPVFLLALGWSERDAGPLDRFMVWTWPAGDCTGLPSYRAGRIGN